MDTDQVSATDLRRWVERFAAVVHENRAELTELDSAIGDADHGANLDRGLTAVVGALAEDSPTDIAGLLKRVGMTLVSTVGGASGPLYGTFFLRMSTAAGNAATLDGGGLNGGTLDGAGLAAAGLAAAGLNGAGPDGAGPDGAGPDGAGPDGAGLDGAGLDGAGLDGAGLAAALRAGLGGIVARGKAVPGDKTMLDALTPALEAMDAALAAGRPCAEALRSAARAADEGRDATTAMIARKGRASYLGERSAGHQDPGATSMALLITALGEALDEAAGGMQ